jgi:hypothetical protein
MKKPPGHDARRPLLRLPVSQFRRYPATTRVRPEGSPRKQKAAEAWPGGFETSGRSARPFYWKSVDKLEKCLQGQAVLEEHFMIAALTRRPQFHLPAVPTRKKTIA